MIVNTNVVETACEFLQFPAPWILVHIFLSHSDAGALQSELSRTARELAPDLFAADGAPGPAAFASQCLPEAAELAVPSINVVARDVSDRLIAGLADTSPWRLHVYGAGGYPRRSRRTKLIEAAVRDTLKKRRRSLLKQLRPADAADAAFTEREGLVQLVLIAEDRGYLSIVPNVREHEQRMNLSPCLAGWCELPENKVPPSRAYRKLEEAQLQFGRKIQAGEVCADLGASPGGWTWVALQAGASVIAVDRSELRKDLMQHEGLRFVKGDAFAFEPERPVDWLLSDVIAFPDRIFTLLERWLSRGRCRNFCVTVKFRGAEDYAVLGKFKAMLAEHAAEFFLRRLSENKNEVTAFGRGR